MRFLELGKELLTNNSVAQPAEIQLAMNHILNVERGAQRSGTELELTSPISTAVQTTRPLFRWRQVPGATEYKVTIATGDRAAVIWEQAVGGRTAFVLPPRSPELPRGKAFSWNVETTIDGNLMLSEPGYFWVLDQASSETVREAEQEFGNSALALAAVYEAYGLYDNAESRIRELADLNPGDPRPTKMLAALLNVRRKN